MSDNITETLKIEDFILSVNLIEANGFQAQHIYKTAPYMIIKISETHDEKQLYTEMKGK